MKDIRIRKAHDFGEGMILFYLRGDKIKQLKLLFIPPSSIICYLNLSCVKKNYFRETKIGVCLAYSKKKEMKRSGVHAFERKHTRERMLKDYVIEYDSAFWKLYPFKKNILITRTKMKCFCSLSHLMSTLLEGSKKFNLLLYF